MQAQVIGQLPQSRESDPSFRIWQETDGGMDSKLTAVFLYGLKTHGKDYLPKANPIFPNGFEMDHNTYLSVNETPAKRSEAWKAILEKYSGYFAALWEVRAENLSNLHFLKEARNHFEKVGMEGNAMKVGTMIARFV